MRRLYRFYLLIGSLTFLLTPLYARKSDWKTSAQDTITISVGNVQYHLLRVDGGIFDMGGTREQCTEPLSTDKPVHQVVLDSYFIGQTEVTRALWKAVMGEAPKEGGNDWLADNLPQEWISWDDCQTFIQRLDSITGLDFRLPTEAEWEYAARGGQHSKHYKFAGSDNATAVGWIYSNSGRRTHAVATLQPNELGLYDLTGNVWEWCSDHFGLYTNNLQVNPLGQDLGDLRVVRGGSWDNAMANVNLSVRQGREPNYTFYDCGFRLALSDEPSQPETTFLPALKKIRVKGVQFNFYLVTPDTLPPFYIAQTELTQAQWKTIMHHNPSARKNMRNPVEEVSWTDCQLFIAYLNQVSGLHFRLPTSAEWQYAAEGGQLSIAREHIHAKVDSATIAANRPKYITYNRRKTIRRTNNFLKLLPFGGIEEPEDAILYDYRHQIPDTIVPWLYAGGDDPNLVAWHYGNSKHRPHKVKSKNTNELDLYDMSGNVAEWTQDQLVCGGSWFEHPNHCQVTSSKYLTPTIHTPYIGFRLVLIPK